MADVRYQIAIDRQLDPGLTDEAVEIGVEQSIDSPTSFRVRFAVDICGGDLTLIEDDRLTPGQPDTEVTVVVVVDGQSHVLVHGIITERQVSLAEGGAGSWLEVRGQDRRAVMNREERCESYTGRASDIAQQILSGYGFDTDIEDTEIEYSEDSNPLNQTETDLAFVDKIAGNNGYHFWLDWDAQTAPTGFSVTETAHFKSSPPRPEQSPLGVVGPRLLAPDDAPELRLNSGDGCSNVRSFELSANAEAPNSTGSITRVNDGEGTVDETEVPHSSDEPLGDDPPAAAPRTRRVVTAGSVQEARVRNQAAVDDAAWSVRAKAETSVNALGGVVAPHQILRVIGGGRLNSGNYFVGGVTHEITSSDHKLRIDLLRNSLGGS
ncbi:hypothetical protein [Paraliomyxa miuraensis]|uniref:hypothetical protein n=1 Tax=Paraliomyxa miuraensis TaxID=376150 RepID=UPI002257CB6C|nr:hypothetical protein [Paraliomyxa miuraensis]MCX4245553.1 hypothetical protein [Paraliomyxa miuraensis]